MASFRDTKIELDCPSCGRTLRATLRDVESGRTVRCSMGHAVELKEEGRGIAQTDRALRDLERALKRFGR